jgi:beta-mannosidase
MHITYAFCVDGILNQGKNTLKVAFHSPIEAVKDKPLLQGAFTRERMQTRRIQCTYSWDWVDRFVTMGIFRDVRLVYRNQNEIDSFYIFTKDINPYSAQMQLNITLRDFTPSYDLFSIEVFTPDGKLCYKKSRALLKESYVERFDIRAPQLWYPNGYGAQPLYKLVITTPNSKKEFLFGIRKLTVLELIDEEGTPERETALKLKNEPHIADKDNNEDSSCFTVLVNDIKIMCKGGNWVPCEPFPSAETPEKITQLLELGVKANVNMLRVWGGGIFEQEHFYNECDRLGILVTQDFLMACGEYPEKEEWFINELKKETVSAALRLRNHTCLAWWSGDNENAVNGHEETDNYRGYLAATYGIEPILNLLDPQRYFFASSPYGGKPYSSYTKGTTHNTYFLWTTLQYILKTDMHDYIDYLATYLARFNAEQAAIGMPFVSSLRKFLTDEDIFGNDTSMSEYHTKNNPALKPSLYEYIEIMSQKIFGEFTDGQDRIRKMQMLHTEWVRISMELFRRNKWYSSGIIYWMFNDCWPAANGWSIVDYYAMPKPAYYIFKRCAQNILCCLERKNNKLEVRISNDSLVASSGNGRLYVYDFVDDRDLISFDFEYAIDKNTAECVYSVDYSEIKNVLSSSTVVLCDINDALNCDRAHWIPSRYTDLDITYSDVCILEETCDSITLKADEFTPFAIIDVPYILEENCFPMKKGEIKKIKKIKEN